jgi:hypothetical protein
MGHRRLPTVCDMNKAAAAAAPNFRGLRVAHKRHQGKACPLGRPAIAQELIAKMLTPKVQQLGSLPTAHGPWLPPPACGHRTHVGTCAECQRRQIAKWAAQLQHATAQAVGHTY